MEPFISEIRLFPYADPPDGWLPCDGRILPIREHQALFSLIEWTYGGDGQATFALPDIRGLIPAAADEQRPAGKSFALLASDAGSQAALALNFCISIKGIYPSEL